MAWIGVDLGGTKIQTVALEDDEVVADARAKTPRQGGPLAVVDAIVDLVTRLSEGRDVTAVGVGAPGVVDIGSGVVRSAPNLQGWVEPFDLRQTLSDALDGLPVVVDNDVNVGSAAEHRLGAGLGANDMLGVFVGTGVGAALVLDGKLRRGPTGLAGELGHTIVVRGGRRCACGKRGHLEAYAGRAAMERRARTLESRGRDSMLVQLAPARRMTSSVFAKALAGKDKVANELIDEAVGALGTAIASAVTLLDVPLVVMGGGLADRLGHPFVGRVEEATRSELYLESASVRIVPAQLGDQGGAVGAALVAGQSTSRQAARAGRSRR